MDNGLIRFLPKSKDRDGLYSTTMIISSVISIAITIIFIIGINYFSSSLIFLREGWLPIILILYVILTSVNAIQNTAFIALRKGDLALLQNLILGIRIPLLFIVASFGIIGILSSLGIAYLLTTIFGLYVMYRLGVKFQFKINSESLKETLGFSIGNYTAGIFLIAPITIIPILIINTIGAENGAYFYIAYSLANLLFAIPWAISMSLFVEGSHNIPLKDNVIKSLKFIMALLLPAILIVFCFGDKLLLLFSKEFSVQSFELLKLMAISSLFSAIPSIYMTIKRIQKDIRFINYMNLIFSAALIVIGYLSLITCGLIGIGYSWLILNILASIIIIFIIYKYDKFFNDY
jgi:O-antigen/teichoic acid export membrane protein